MEIGLMVIIALFVIGYGAISGRLDRTVITGPMIFVAFGYLLSEKGFGLIEADVEHEFINLIAELTLIIVLFSDATRINLKLLRKEHDLPIRLLAIGLPLTILAGILFATMIFTEFGFWEAAVLATILAPTDAALAQVVLSGNKVPARIRQALNVESGLNDGMALPILLLFISLVENAGQTESIDYWLGFGGQQLILAPIIGIMVGYLGGQIIQLTTRNGWMSDSFQRLSALGIALLAYALAEYVGGNGFVSAFVAGLTLGNTARAVCNCIYEFAEAEGQFLILITFMIFGAVMLPPEIEHFTGSIILYCVLSLTIIRMLPVFISLIGTKVKFSTMLFIGWFGPRGVASILYALIIVEAVGIPMQSELVTITVATVFISVFVHGLSALPGVNLYINQLVPRMQDDTHEMMPEEMPVTEMPLRHTIQYPSGD